MKTALLAIESDVDDDIRDAALQAAQRDGLSLGDWLDRVMTRSADALGLGLADLGPNERIEAVRQRLGWAEDEARRREPAGPPDTVRVRVEAPAISRPERDADLAVIAPVEAARQSAAVSRQTAQRVEIEAKLNALFKALDHPVRRIAHAASVATPESSESGRLDERARVLMGETAISPSQRLETAIAEISDRQSYLDSKLEADPLPVRRRPTIRFGAPRAAAEDLRQQFGPADAMPAMGDVPGQTAGETPGAIATKASVFTSLQGGAAVLPPSDGLAGAPSPAPSRDTDFSDVRALLDEMRPDRSVDLLGRHVEALTARLDKVIDRPASADAIQRLSLRIEEVHAELSKRLAVMSTEPAMDARRLDGMVRDAIGRLEAERNTGPVLQDLQSGVSALAARLDAAQNGQDGDREALAALQGQIASMAAAIDRSQAEVSALADVRTAMTEAVARVEAEVEALPELIAETTRDAVQRVSAEQAAELAALHTRLDAAQAEQAADHRTVADLQAQIDILTSSLDRSQDGLAALVTVTERVNDLGYKVDAIPDVVAEAARAAALGTDLAGAAGGVDSAAALAISQVVRDLAEFRDGRQDADKRLNLVLAALNTSLERVVDRLGRLEDDMAQGGSARVAAPTVGADKAEAAQARPVLEPAPVAAEPVAEPMMLDTPVQPVPVPPAVRLAPEDGAMGETPDPASFIAAARRAARTAAQEQAAGAASRVAPRTASGVLSGVDRPAAGGRRESRSRRPLLLALASLVLLLGAAQVVRIGLSSESPVAAGSNGVSTEGAPKSTMAEPLSAPEATKPAEPATTHAATPAASAPGVAAPATPTPAVSPQSSLPAAVPAGTAAEASAPKASLPTMAIGPAAAVAAARVSENAARAAGAGLGAGLRTAAEGGNAAAQYEVGLRFAEGRGVDRDMTAASAWFEKAANQGLAPAAYRLGSLYEKGLGVTRDAARATAWYLKAAEAGNVRAMHNLAVMMAEGASGKPDYPAASAWFARAADAGVRDSQFNLAILYARGLGVTQDLAQSYQWFALAAAQGDADAAKKRDEVAQRLSADALAKAKAAVASFKASTPLTAANDVATPAGGWDAPKPQAANDAKSARVSSM